MTGNKTIKIIAIVIILAAAFYLGFYYGKDKAIAPDLASLNNSIAEGLIDKDVSLMLDFGDGNIQSFKDIAWQKNQNLFDLLKQVTAQNSIELSYKDYGGDLGVFIESIGGVKNNNDSWWQYWVNNQYAEKGASSYLVQPADVIVFKFVKGQINY